MRLNTILVAFGSALALGTAMPAFAWSQGWDWDEDFAPDITIAIRMNRTNTDALDYYLLPQFEMRSKPLGLAEENGLMLDAFRFETLNFFFDMARRVSGLPVCVGFGVKAGTQAAEMAKIADGVVVGSAFVEHAEAAQESGDFACAPAGMGALAKELSTAIAAVAKV